MNENSDSSADVKSSMSSEVKTSSGSPKIPLVKSKADLEIERVAREKADKSQNGIALKEERLKKDEVSPASSSKSPSLPPPPSNRAFAPAPPQAAGRSEIPSPPKSGLPTEEKDQEGQGSLTRVGATEQEQAPLDARLA